MYLVPRPYKQAMELIAMMKVDGLHSEYLPIIELQINLDQFQLFQNNIYQFDSLIFTSPSSVEVCANLLVYLPIETKIFAVGKATAESLAKYIRHHIIYPQQNSGVQALIDECLTSLYLTSKKIAIIGGDKLNSTLENYLLKINCLYSNMTLYNRNNIGLNNLNLLEKSLSNQSLEGVIITSSIILDYFLECITLLKKMHCLNSLKLISIHDNITQLLKKRGFKCIYQSKNASNQSVIKLLKGIRDV